MATLQHHQIQSQCGCVKANCNCFPHDLQPPEKKQKLTSHDYASSDDEDDFGDDGHGDGLHDVTKKEFRIYSKQVEESDGKLCVGYKLGVFEVRPKGASDDDCPPQIFQAKVWDGVPGFKVDFCRPKPNPLKQGLENGQNRGFCNYTPRE